MEEEKVEEEIPKCPSCEAEMEFKDAEWKCPNCDKKIDYFGEQEGKD